MGKRIDEKRDVMAYHEPQYAASKNNTEHVAAGPAEQQRQAEVHTQRQRQVVAVLIPYQRVALQIAHGAKVRLSAR